MAKFRIDLFPTPIWVAHSDNPEIRERAKILAYKFKSNPGVAGIVSEGWEARIKTDNKSDHEKQGVTSYYSGNLAENKDWGTICDFILAMAGTMMGDTYDVTGMTIGNMWTTVYPQGAFVPQHIHNNVMVSGVYYVKAEPNCGDLVFTDPSWVAKTNSTPDTAPVPFPAPRTKWSLPVKTGDMVLFPGWLPHNSRPNASGEDRIIVSFNLRFGNCNIRWTHGPL
jgi:uncharacterized protein (TIGR02466 family)